MKWKIPKSNINLKKLIIAITIGCVIGGLIAATIVVTKNLSHERFPAGTFVAGIDISRMTTEEGKEKLNKAKNQYLETSISITLGNKKKSLKLKELGINIYVDETLEIISGIDREILTNKIKKEFNLQEITPISAIFYFNETGELAIKEGKNGMVLSEEKLITELKKSTAKLKPTTIKLALLEKEPKITGEELSSQIGKIKEILNHKIILVDPIYSDDWTFRLTDHLDWVQFIEKQKTKLPYIGRTIITNPIEGLDGESIITIEIDQKKLDGYIDKEISRWLDKPPGNVNIYTNKNGEIIIEGKGSDGLKIQRKIFKKSIELAVENKIKEIVIPVITINPIITISKDLQTKGIKERIAVGHTSYYRSPPNRVHNIKIGSSKFNGLLIAPGEKFSFNKNLGKVDGTTGYKKELVIKKEGTIPEYGGGICQVSTTMFRAALFAGVPIAERNQHSYAVSYYSQILGHGLDATVYLGGADLKFINDTDGYILIQTYVKDDYELYIVFYGTPTGRTIKMEGPYLSDYVNPGPTIYEKTKELLTGETKQVEKAHTGFHTLWYRHITYPDGTAKKEPIETNFRAIPSKILIGEGSEENEEPSN